MIMQSRFLLTVAAALCLAAGCQSPPSRPTEVKTIAPPPAEMVLVSADSFIMGSDQGQTNELPQRKLDLPAFYMDVREVTNAEYSKFLQATRHMSPEEFQGLLKAEYDAILQATRRMRPNACDQIFNSAYSQYLLAMRPPLIPPPGWTGFNPPKGKEACAVSNISAYEAGLYARWAGKRLPTEEEWEKAARGKDGRCYPWGDRWDPDMGATSVESRDVNQFPNAASPYGCIGMAGNVREWTGSPYALAIKSDTGGVPAFLAPFAYLFNGITLKTKYAKPVGALESTGGVATDDRVVKGGPTQFRGAFECRSSFRESYETSTRDETIGFRCAKDAP